MVKLIIEEALQKGGATEKDKQNINSLPVDIRGIRKRFGLEAKTTIYASCPRCCYTYAPKYHSGIPIYPAICTDQRLPQSQPCGTNLTSVKVIKGKSVRSPLRPFPVQCFDTFVGGLLSRPGIEDALEEMAAPRSKDVLVDIVDGDIVRSIEDITGQPFINPDSGEHRLVWAVSVDWFNPYLNKIAGKTASIGLIVLSCLSLPPGLRYKPENIYLMGIIPGPREPSTSQTNHYLRPLVDKFVESYSSGTWYTRTYKYPRGRRSRSALAVEVCDLPAARKVSGHTSHSAETFCMLCHLSKGDINNLETGSWKVKTNEEFREAGSRWKNASTKKEQEAITKKTGVRWTELNRLPYWHHRRVGLDGMHKFFLGLVPYHFREALGMDLPSSDNDSKNADPSDIARARDILADCPTQGALKRIPVGALKALCGSQGLLVRDVQRPKKKDLITLLLVSGG